MTAFSKGLRHSPRTFVPKLIRLSILSALAVTSSALAQTQKGESTAPNITKLAPILAENQDVAVSEGTGQYSVPVASTSTRLPLSPRETPQSVNVVTRTQIDDFGLNNATSLLSTVPGMFVQQVETDRNYYNIRGYEVTNFQVDGIGLQFSTEEQMGDLDMAFYDRVEVLKGANGLLTNTGNPSGTVNFIRKRPKRAFSANANLSYSSFATRRLDTDITTSLNSSGSVRGRLIAAYQKGNSYLDRYGLDKKVFGVIVDADLGDRTTLTLGHAYQKNKARSAMWGALPLHYTDGSPVYYDVSDSTAPDWAYWNTEDQTTFAELAHDWGAGWNTKATLMYRKITQDAEHFFVDGVPDRVTGLGLLSWPTKYNRYEKQWIGDISTTGKYRLAGREHDVMFGINVSRSKNYMTSLAADTNIPLPSLFVWNRQFPRPDFYTVEPSGADFIDRKTTAFIATRLNLTDAFKVIAGVNYTRATSDGVQYKYPHYFRRNKLSPYLGLIYDLNRNYSVYASYTGIFNPQFRYDVQGQLVPALEGRNYELGLKGESDDGRLTGSVALFRAEQNNTAEYDTFKDGLGRYKAVDSRSAGFELALQGEVLPGLQVSTGYSRLFSIKDESGKAVREYVPKSTFTIAATYAVPAVSGLKVGGAVRWQSEIRRLQGKTPAGVDIYTKQKAYAVADLMASYELNKHVTIGANVKNVFNKKYLTSLMWAQSYYAPSRSVGMNVQLKY
ncbi:TonB-dependent siderophore receptor [Advenella mimigardefordensis]|uniref:Putative TonB-dependent outer membrane ferripyoverdine receptor n=1 Tax=Advenella mimigardefordensis (strain DSM 17166 / LMG 22922 / DPN7) TaxID=1247726 RepID=W0PGD1_ADVMD|nr:TonB-dependent siderophore receptor [Advenella mimigardefordensis]AHG64657.1 putative TonB-dependent outer membrane ferripyoverdine receptor [Advenella mimigardefordensis DPN7]